MNKNKPYLNIKPIKRHNLTPKFHCHLQLIKFELLLKTTTRINKKNNETNSYEQLQKHRFPIKPRFLKIRSRNCNKFSITETS